MITLVRIVETQGGRESAVYRVNDTEAPTLRISLGDWSDRNADLLEFDAVMHRQEDQAKPFCLVLEGVNSYGLGAARQVLTRYQRLLPLNGVNDTLRAVLPVHRRLFDLAKPLVRADYDHAVDTWRWVLRLDPHASVALQLAALFHDIERLATEADVRREHLVDDYLEFKREHARDGSAHAVQFLSELGLDSSLIGRVSELIRNHEQPGRDAEIIALNDADSLSFFSLNSWGFYRYFGEKHTHKKVRYTLQRMRAEAVALLPEMRLHPVVAEFSGITNEVRA